MHRVPPEPHRPHAERLRRVPRDREPGAHEALPGVIVGVDGGAGYDVVTEAVRGYVGPQLGLPQAFGAFGGVELGYAEELGFWSGRTGWASTLLSPFSSLRLVTRASSFESEAIGDSVREIALMTLADAPILPWLTVRARAQVQTALLPLDGSKREAPSLLVADVGITGSM